jgi:phage tail P2-like protein
LLVYLVDVCADELLPVLADEWGIAGHPIWRLAKSAEQQRAVLKSAPEINRRAGTPWAVREVVRALGWGEITLVEGAFPNFSVALASGVYLSAEDAANLREAIESVAPVRCHLTELTTGNLSFVHNGFVLYNGDATYSGGA